MAYDSRDEEQRRKAIHELLTELALQVEGESALLLGWAIVVEWVAPNNDRWLTCLATDARGEPAPTWQMQGYFHNALHDWPDGEEDDADE